MKVNFIENGMLEDNLIILQAKEKNDIILSIINDIEKNALALECSSFGKNSLISIQNFTRFITSEKKVYGHTENDKEFIIKQRLYQLEEMLPKQFLRISNTEIINVKYISKLKLTSSGIIIIKLKNGTQTSSSRRYLKKIKERLT